MRLEELARGLLDGAYRRAFDLAEGGVHLNPRQPAETYPTSPNDEPRERTEPWLRPVCR